LPIAESFDEPALQSADRPGPISYHCEEKLELRVILNQRVFETTFIVNPVDLFDGTETVLRTPTRVDEPTPAALP
jgi:hypothetical protein